MLVSTTITEQRADYHGKQQRIALTVAGDYEAPEPSNGLANGLLIVERVEVGVVDIYPILTWEQIERIGRQACEQLDRSALHRHLSRAA